MAEIKINLDEVNYINSRLPRYVAALSGISRELKISMWKMNPEILVCRDIEERLKIVIREIENAQQQLQNIHNAVSSAVVEYGDMERVMTRKAEEFY